MNIPLRIFDRNQGEKKRTLIDIDRSQQLTDAARAQVFSDVDSAYEQVRSNIALLIPYRDKYKDQATRVRDTVTFSYQHGGASLMDFLNAQSDYRVVQLAYLQLVGSYLTAAASSISLWDARSSPRSRAGSALSEFDERWTTHDLISSIEVGTMNREEVRARIEDIGIMPSIRVASAELALFAAETVYEAGIPVVEITMTVPNAVEVIAQLTQNYPNFVVGAGTVLDTETAQRCLDAGARFITSPGLVPDVLEFTLKNDVAAIPGALTPSEVIAAWKAGADFVKIYPCAQVGGDQYIRALKVPLPQIKLIASGGVNQLTAANFIFAGAASLGIGSELMPRQALKMRKDQWIRELARRFLEAVRSARIHLAEID